MADVVLIWKTCPGRKPMRRWRPLRWSLCRPAPQNSTGPGMLLRTDTTLLNGHGGTQAAPGMVVAKARQDLRVATALSPTAAADLLRERFGRAYAHACKIEASVALAADQDLVRPDALTAGDEHAPPYQHAVLVGGGAGAGAFVDAALRMDELTANGALGHPRRASREMGEAVLRLAEDRLVEFLEDFVSGRPDPP